MARGKTLTDKDGPVPPSMFSHVPPQERPGREIPLSLLPPSDWRPPDVSSLPSWKGSRRVGIDTETKDDDIKTMGPGCRRPGNRLVGVSFAIEDGPSHYLPFGHAGGDNLDEGSVLGYLREQARHFEGELVGAHLAYDMDWMLTAGIDFRPRAWRDVLLAAPLIDELKLSYSLEAVATDIGLPGKDTLLLFETARRCGFDPKQSMHKMAARHVGPYATADAVRPLQVLRRQEREIEAQDLGRVWDLETSLLPVLVTMRRRGLRFSHDRLGAVEQWTLDEELRALQVVWHHTGENIEVGDVWRPEPMAAALRAIGVEVPKTATGTDSVRKDILASVDHPVAHALARARKVNKLRTTFVASIRRFAIGDRIHCTFNQMRATDDDSGDEKGAKYGRLSSEDPNMQQQPSRDELARPWRRIFLPDEGRTFAAPDYSQQEPRWLTSFAEIMKLPRAKETAQRYRDDPSTDNHDMMTRMIFGAEVDEWGKDRYKRTRGFCKEIYLGKCYGMGGAKLARKLGLSTRWAVFWAQKGRPAAYAATREGAVEIMRSTRLPGRVWEVAGEEAQAIVDKFDAEVPFVRGMSLATENQAKDKGFIRTYSGRRCRFPIASDGSYDWTHKALNRLIQGCAADQTKMAMVAMHEAGIALQLQVHDEICWSASSEAEARQGAEIMRDVVRLGVPFKVDLETGPSWGETEALA